MKISRKLRRELMVIALDLLTDGQVNDLEVMCSVLEAIAAEGRKELKSKPIS